MATFLPNEPLREPDLDQSEAFLNRSWRRLVEVLAPFVLQRIQGTDLFKSKRKRLLPKGAPTRDVLQFLRVMVPGENPEKNEVAPLTNWEDHFSDLDKGAKSRVDLIIRFRNEKWAHFGGYNDEDVLMCMGEIRKLLEAVALAQGKDPKMVDLVDATSDKEKQIAEMWTELGKLIFSEPDNSRPEKIGASVQPEPLNIRRQSGDSFHAGDFTESAPDIELEEVDSGGDALISPTPSSNTSLDLSQMKNLVSAARSAFKDEDFNAAVVYYDTLRAFDKSGELKEEHSKALHARGKLRTKSRQFGSAIEDFAKAKEIQVNLSLDPEDAAAYHNLANEELFNGNYHQAIEHFNKVLSINSGFSVVYFVSRKSQNSLGGFSSRSGNFHSSWIWELYHDRGMAYLEIERYDLAIADFKESDLKSPNPRQINEHGINIASASITLQRNPRNARGYRDLGRAYTASGQYDRAIAELSKAQNLDQEGNLDCSQEFWEIYSRRGAEYVKSGYEIQEMENDDAAGLHLFERAVEDYTAALDIDSTNASLYHARGVARFVLGRYSLAIEDYNIALDSDPAVSSNYIDSRDEVYEFYLEECMFDRGKALSALGEYGEAVGDFESVLLSGLLVSWPDCDDPESYGIGIEVYNELGNAHFGKGDFDLAINSYSSGIDGQRDGLIHLELWKNRGKAYFSNRQFIDAVNDFSYSIEQFPGAYGPLELLKLRGQAYVELGNFEKAIVDYDTHLDAYAQGYVMDHVEVRELRRIAISLRDAESEFHQDVIRHPDNANNWAILGWHYLEAGNFVKSLENLDTAVEKAPENAEIRTLRGRALMGLVLHDRAMEELNEAIRLQPDCADAWKYRAQLLRVEGSHRDAVNDCDKLIALQPKNADAYKSRAVSKVFLIDEGLFTENEVQADFDKAHILGFDS